MCSIFLFFLYGTVLYSCSLAGKFAAKTKLLVCGLQFETQPGFYFFLPVSTILLAEIFFIKSLFSISSLSAYPLATTNFVLIAFYFECFLEFSKHFFEPVHFRTTTFSDFLFAKHIFEMTFSNCPYHSRLEPWDLYRYYNFWQFFCITVVYWKRISV